MKQTIDAKGWDCPRPIIETKKLLDTMREGTVLTIVDNKIAVDNLINFSESMGYQVVCTEENGLFNIEVTKAYSEYDEVISGKSGLVVQISSNTYGSESDGLGENLIKAYVYALTETSVKPKTILFINKGVFLTTEGSPVLDSLQALEAEGVEILSCGACLNFFGLEGALQIGGVTNMYAMAELMCNAGGFIKV